MKGEYRCVRGEMLVSKQLYHMLQTAASDNATREVVASAEDSRFRCVLCRVFMKQGDQPGAGLHCPSCHLQYSSRMTYNMTELHPHAKFLEPGQKERYSVLLSHEGNLTAELLAEHIQLVTHSSAARAWQIAEQIQKTGQAVIFSGHPQDAQLVASRLKIAGIRLELIEDSSQ
jgi:hypothetical protein